MNLTKVNDKVYRLGDLPEVTRDELVDNLQKAEELVGFAQNQLDEYDQLTKVEAEPEAPAEQPQEEPAPVAPEQPQEAPQPQEQPPAETIVIG